MLKLIKNNMMIAAGILLPLIVVVFFLLATAIPKMMVDPPKHDLVFTQPHHEAGPIFELRFDVFDDRVRARIYKSQHNYRNVPKLYLYDVSESSVRELTVDLPDDLENFEEGTEVTVSDLADRPVTSLRKAPDGYEVAERQHRRDSLLRFMFGGGNKRGLMISKGGAVVPVPPTQSDQYYYGTRFVGWLTD